MSAEALDILRSIDASLKQLVKQTKAAAGKSVASDRDLDGQYGDPVVKFNPRDWTGESFKGRRLSECPPDFLDLLAQAFDYFGDQAEQKDERTAKDKPVADYKRADAARARGWAKRIREGKVTTPAGTGSMGEDAWGGADTWEEVEG